MYLIRMYKAHVTRGARDKVELEQLKVVRLSWQVSQLLASRVTNFLDRNNLKSSSISLDMILGIEDTFLSVGLL